MFILSRDGEKFINFSNVVSIYMYKEYRQYTNPDTRWEIRVAYSTGMSENFLYDTLDTYYDKEDCKNAFGQLCNQIAKSREHEIIDMGYLWDY